jgi:Phage integrase, N-terminal SAM-like domain
VTGLLIEYNAALQRQPLSAHTRRAYRVRVHQYADYLRSRVPDYGNSLQDPHARDYVVRDYKMFLKTVRRAKPRTVTLSLAAIDHFYEFLGLGKPAVRREELPQQGAQHVVTGGSEALSTCSRANRFIPRPSLGFAIVLYRHPHRRVRRVGRYR